MDDCTPYALFTMCGTSYLAHTVASSSSLRKDNEEIKSVTHSLEWEEEVTQDIPPVRDPRGEAGSCGVNAEDVLRPQLLDLLLHCLQVGPQFVALQDVFHHHRFKT